MMNALTLSLLKLLMPALIGALSFALTQWAKRKWADVDRQPPEVKQAIVAGWSFALNVLAQTVGKSVCVDGSAFCEPPDLAFSAILSYAVASTIFGRRRKG
jgi:hypothetical protein